MRARLVIGVVLVTAVGVATAHAGFPPLRVLAKAHGRVSVTVATRTNLLRGRVWFVRSGGLGVATARASVSCRANGSGTDTWFTFKVKPNGRREVWRYHEAPCTIEVSLTGRGVLDASLRGY